MTRRASDRIAGAILFGLAVWYWAEAGEYRVAFGDPAGPSLFPRIVAVPMALFSLAMVLRPDPDPVWLRWPAAWRQGAALVVLFAYPVLIKPIGFPAATFLEVFFLALVMGGPLLGAVLSAAGLSITLFLLFDRVFGLPLPPGPFFG